ncbi:MAG: hypothetical protein MI748_13595, partial [Opitutales bacterium]|nr:hypothetical protein [Opitutales bacterium]
AAMAVPAFQQVRKSSSEKAALNDLRQIAAAADQYFLENNLASVNVSDLTGTYIKSLNSSNTYPTSVAATDTQLTATTAFGTVAYDLE